MFGSKSQYQVILKEIELNMVDHKTCEDKLQSTRLGAKFQLDESFNCAGGVAGIDVCTGNVNLSKSPFQSNPNPRNIFGQFFLTHR